VTGSREEGSPLGLHRVLKPGGVLPQAAWRLDSGPAIWPDEVRIRVDRLNLDAASYRQLRESTGGSAEAMRGAVLQIVADRGKMQNPVTGSGGMLTGVVDEAGPDSPLGLAPGDRVATLVSLSLTPLAITDGLAGWDGQSEQVPCAGHAILFGRSIAAVLPGDLPTGLALTWPSRTPGTWPGPRAGWARTSGRRRAASWSSGPSRCSPRPWTCSARSTGTGC
jgi:L-erythro-3,5-diaminohexanoate dehydrogenase